MVGLILKRLGHSNWREHALEIVWKDWHGLSKAVCTKYLLSVGIQQETDEVYNLPVSTLANLSKRSLRDRANRGTDSSSGKASTDLRLQFSKVIAENILGKV